MKNVSLPEVLSLPNEMGRDKLMLFFTFAVGWLSSSAQQPYDQHGYGAVQGDVGVKARMVDLISAVRTLMRSAFHSYAC